MTLFRVLKERVGDHPNIVRLLEVYFDEPPFYVVMDHVEGQDLKAWCEQQGGMDKVPLPARLEIVAQIADALQAAHDAGVIHRDVKPANILVSNPKSETRNPKLEAKLTDFGIGQVVSEEALKGITKTGFTQTILADSSSSQTGSQMYMAPELLASKPASTRSDIYSLGVVLYQFLVGDFSKPITTDWGADIADGLLRDDLQHCFAGNPQERFAGAGLLAKNLRSLPQRQAALATQQAELAAREKAAYRRGIVRTAVAAATSWRTSPASGNEPSRRRLSRTRSGASAASRWTRRSRWWPRRLMVTACARGCTCATAASGSSARGRTRCATPGRPGNCCRRRWS